VHWRFYYKRPAIALSLSSSRRNKAKYLRQNTKPPYKRPYAKQKRQLGKSQKAYPHRQQGPSPLPHPFHSEKQAAASKSETTVVPALGQTAYLEEKRAKTRGDPKTQKPPTKL